MFISKKTLNEIYSRISEIEESADRALGRLTRRIDEVNDALAKDREQRLQFNDFQYRNFKRTDEKIEQIERLKAAKSDIISLENKLREDRAAQKSEYGILLARIEAEEERTADKCGILLARIKASENGRFVYDEQTGKVVPVITGIGDAQRELAAEVMKTAEAAAPKPAPKRKPEPNADDEPALFTQAQREKVRRFYDLNFDILNALKITRVENGTPIYLSRRKNGNSTACRYAEKYAPEYARFVNSMYDAGARISYILTAAADRGIIFTERGKKRKSPRIYMKEEIIEVYTQAEKYISEHREKFEEFIREGAPTNADH